MVSGVIVADEGDTVLGKAVLWLQKQQEGLREEGISVNYDEEEYVFLPEYIDR